MKGYADAKKYYRGYKTAATLTFVASLYSPVVGMIPAGACGFSSPEYQSLGFPDAELMKNSDYKLGYTNKAKKIKQQKVLKNWLIPTSIWVGAVAAIAIVLEGANFNWIP